MKGPSRQLANRQLRVLRSLFRTLHPYLTDLQTNLSSLTQSSKGKWAHSSDQASTALEQQRDSTDDLYPTFTQPPNQPSKILRSITDENLIVELDGITGAHAATKMPQRNQHKHYSRDKLLTLLEEASVRIQVLETELELARSDQGEIPLLTDEWEASTSQTPKPLRAVKPPRRESV